MKHTHTWIQNVLQGRSHRVVSEGTQSSSHPGLSAVLGPILFLICNNDLPDEAIGSTIRLFADDCILYRSFKTKHDSTLLQTDLNYIAQWELTGNTHAYQALVRPHLEHASAVWDPHTHYNTQKCEMVQRRAAVFMQSLAQHHPRHRNAQPAGVDPCRHAWSQRACA